MVQAIRFAEKQTSGEIRLFIESRCKFINPVDRAIELFSELKMYNTQDRNGVIIYIAMKDRQLAIYGDEGIHKRLGQEFWLNEVNKIIEEFHEQHFLDGILKIIADIGEALKTHFPYDKADNNELEDGIVFGK
ncbi:MAG: TPM domain-containing protein, partial [bacterium]